MSKPHPNDRKTVPEELTVFGILQLWRDALSKALCVKHFYIQDDGKTFDYDLKDEGEFKCDNCKSEFCFKSLEWLEDCGDDGNSKLNKNTYPKSKEIEFERAYV